MYFISREAMVKHQLHQTMNDHGEQITINSIKNNGVCIKALFYIP